MTQVSRRPACLFHAIAVTLALVSAPVAAQPVEQYRPIVAKELYDGIMSGGLASWVEDPAQRTALSTYMATSNIWAVADSTQGKKWGLTPSLDLVKMAESVLAYLDELPTSRQSEGAAVIVAESLGKTYPCPR